jgi:putative inorganic carbon (HCO3(-)) transporter
MGFLLTVAYVALGHLSPADVFPAFSDDRIMLWLAIAAAVATVPSLVTGKFPFRSPEVRFMLGLVVAVPVSRLAHLWFGGMFPALSAFLTTGIVFFLIVANVHTLRRLRVLMVVFLLACLFLLYRSVAAYHSGDLESPYLLQQGVGYDPATGEPTDILIRIRALGFLSDPNDFAQCLLVALPFLGLFWRPGNKLRNFLFVVAPALVILYGVFLTHSRGAVIGLGAIAVALLAKRLGKTRSLIAAVLLVAVMLSPVGGGRESSLSEGSSAGRIIEWGTGIAMLKSSPIFGAGYDAFTNNGELTAHNSYVLCFAELGLFGYFFWLGLIVFTVTKLNTLLNSVKETDENRELLRCARVLRLSLFGFLATAWLLSRTYIVTFYMLIGMAVAVIQMLSEEPMRSEETEENSSPAWSPLKLTAWLEVASIVAVYLFVRLRTF